MAGFALKASYPTVQVLSPTLVNDVMYCTIETSPSNVIASIPVQKDVFDASAGGPELTNFADAIEQVMTSANISTAVGTQSLDASGLLQDFVTFTVFYNPPGTTGQTITADADVPVGYLNFTDALIGEASLANVDKIINDTYANLKALAAG
jgi:hypothetical protein